MKKIVLLCSAGITTNLLANKLKQSVEKFGYNYDVGAYPIAAIDECKDADIVLLGPQVVFLMDSVKKSFSNIYVEALDPKLYSMMDSDAIIKRVRLLLGD